MKKVAYYISIISVSTFLFTACAKKEDAKPKEQGIGDEEAITRFVLELTSGNGLNASASFSDPDGSGPIAPTVTGLALVAGVNYNGTISVYDDSKTPTVFVNEEIEEESNAHRFHYVFTPSSTVNGLTIAVDITDKDENNKPLGLTYNMNVGSVAGTGKLRVTLRHFDNTTKTDNIEDGEADIDQEFDVSIIQQD